MAQLTNPHYGKLYAAWEAANLPPDLAALRAAQREAARRAKEAEAE